METKKIVLDTDMGDDIDDALSLVLAMKMPEIELLGVTTCFRDTQKRARIAKKLVSLWGIDVPVYAGLRKGAHSPDRSQGHIPCGYSSDLEGVFEPDNDESVDGGEAAVDFLISCAKEYGKELRIVAVGPLMNVAAAIEKAPDVMKTVGGISIMGGAFYEHFNEWNFFCDSHSAKTVLESGIPCLCVGHDVTQKTALTKTQWNAMLALDGNEKNRYLAWLVSEYTEKFKRPPILHDPLVVYSVAYPEILETEEIAVRILTEPGEFDGFSLNLNVFYRYHQEKIPSERIKVAKNLDSECAVNLVLAHFLERKETAG